MPIPPSGFVTVTLPTATAAFAAIVTFAVTWVALFHVVEFTVIPAPENDAANPLPLTKPVPVITMLCVTPWPRDDGLTDATVGPVFTVNLAVPVPAPPSGFVTVTSRAPVVAFVAIVMFAVTWVALFHVVEFTVMPAPENDAANPAALTKPVPVIATFCVAPCPRDAGLADVTVGPVFTVNLELPVPDPVSGFVTVTLRAPVVAFAAIVMLAVTWVALFHVVEFTVMPVPENDAANPAPLMKPVPVIATFWLVAPWPRDAGLTDVTVGRASMLSVSVWVSGSSPSASFNVNVSDGDPVAAGVPEMTPVLVLKFKPEGSVPLARAQT